MKIRIVICFSVVVLTSLSVHAQDRPLVELSFPIAPAISFPQDGLPVPSFIVPVNYVVNHRLTAGLTFVYQRVVTSHYVTEYLIDHSDPNDNGSYNNEDKRNHGQQVTGYGMNLKYNLLVNPNYRIFFGLHVLNLTAQPSGQNDRAYEQRAGGPDFISGPLPYEGKSATTFNLNIGCDFRLFRTTFLFAQVDYQDVFMDMPYYYDITIDKTINRGAGELEGVINKVTYTERTSGDVDLVMNLQLGLRVYLMDRKR